MTSSVLIVTRPQDAHADAVTAVLTRRFGVPVHRFDMRSFPLQSSGTLRTSADGHAARLTTQAGSIDLRDVGAVWWRRPMGAQVPQVYSGVDPAFLRSEYEHFVEGLLWDVDGLWVNDPLRNRRAARKVVQVRAAQESGLTVPATVISNDAEAIRAFAHGLDRPLVVKRVGTGPGPASRTTLLPPSSLDDVLAALRPTPAIFQEYIPPGVDLRTIWINGDSWTVRIESGSGTSPEDCRFDHTVPYHVHTLPEPVRNALDALMSSLGLRFGAVDFRVDDKGCTYFLEVNPAGQFLYLQARLEIPLVESLAALLARGTGVA